MGWGERGQHPGTTEAAGRLSGHLSGSSLSLAEAGDPTPALGSFRFLSGTFLGSYDPPTPACMVTMPPGDCD